jgi:type II secretory ATPase GspE/PulE/Tfp pilus assembly ATPase PilB-like protein
MFGFGKKKNATVATRKAAPAAGNGAPSAAPSAITPLVWAKDPVEAEADLFRIGVHQLLAEKLNLAPSLQSHLCPIATDGSTRRCVVFVSPGFERSDELSEMLTLMRKQGMDLMPNGFNAYIVNQQLLLSLSRGDLSPQELATRKKIVSDPRQARLFDAFRDIITWGHENRAADVHFYIYSLAEKSEVKFTIEGKLVAPDAFRLPTATLLDQLGLAWQYSKGGNGSNFNPLIEQDCQIALATKRNKNVMLRWSSMASDTGPNVTLRILDLDVQLQNQRLEDLGYLPSQIAAFRRATNSEGGAIILSGVMASGKSTTLATLAAGIPHTKKLVTLEAPVEYRIPNAIQNTIVFPTTGESIELAAKLKAIKRSGGHAFLLGEIRDQQTGMAYQDLTQSGLDVYTTVHAGRAITIPDRLSSPFIGVARDVLATPGNMKLLVNQALLPMNCQFCKKPAQSLIDEARDAAEKLHWKEYFDRIERLYEVPIDRIKVRNKNGCEQCRRESMPELNGLKGRTVVAEVLEPDQEFLRLVQSARTLETEAYYESLRTTGFMDIDMTGKSAMECAIYKASLGIIDPREIEPRFASFETVELKRKRAAKK